MVAAVVVAVVVVIAVIVPVVVPVVVVVSVVTVPQNTVFFKTGADNHSFTPGNV